MFESKWDYCSWWSDGHWWEGCEAANQYVQLRLHIINDKALGLCMHI